MVDSAVWLDGEVGEGAGGAPEVVVHPDAGGEREQLGSDAGTDAVQGAGVGAFEAEAVFECPEDALDAWRIGARCGPRPGSSWRRGRRIVAPKRSVTVVWKSLPA